MPTNSRLYQIVPATPGADALQVAIPHPLQWSIIRRAHVLGDDIRSKAHTEELFVSEMGYPIVEGVDDAYPWSSVDGYDDGHWDSQPGPHFHSHHPWANVRAILRMNPGEPSYDGGTGTWIPDTNVTVGLAHGVWRIWWHGWEGHVNVIANEIRAEQTSVLETPVSVWRFRDYGGVMPDADYEAWVGAGAPLLDAVAGPAAEDTYVPTARVAAIQLMMPENISATPFHPERYEAVRIFDPALDPPPSPPPVGT